MRRGMSESSMRSKLLAFMWSLSWAGVYQLLRSGVYSASQEKGETKRTTPPGWTMSGRVSTKVRGSGRRQSKFAQRTASKVPREWSPCWSQASDTRNVAFGTWVGSFVVAGVDLPATKGRSKETERPSASVLATATKFSEKSIPTTSSKFSANANVAPPTAQPTSRARPPFFDVDAAESSVTFQAHRRGKSRNFFKDESS
mmetsp:Transcript_18491/g.59636  ORF Transcript_18491/g.59636 Transcript_18491/m.59636 type:complete len:200 (+) Transcript_18491:4694-5293(+)